MRRRQFIAATGLSAAAGEDLGAVLFGGVYYSYISFSTIGYGDIGPIGWAAKVLAAGQGLHNGLFFTLLTFTLFKRVLGGNEPVSRFASFDSWPTLAHRPIVLRRT